MEPLLPSARVGPKGGRREKHPRRRIVDAISHAVRTGCAWRQLPKGFPSRPTVYWYFTRWHDDGTVERVHDVLRGRVREADSRNVEPSAGLIDSQSVRTADAVPAVTRGVDAGKRIKGSTRFLVTDPLGLLGTVHAVAAGVQDRDIARKGTAHGSGPGKTRRAVERAFARLHPVKRLRTRYGTRADLHLGLLQLACGSVCLRRLRTSF